MAVARWVPFALCVCVLCGCSRGCQKRASERTRAHVCATCATGEGVDLFDVLYDSIYGKRVRSRSRARSGIGEGGLWCVFTRIVLIRQAKLLSVCLCLCVCAHFGCQMGTDGPSTNGADAGPQVTIYEHRAACGIRNGRAGLSVFCVCAKLHIHIPHHWTCAHMAMNGVLVEQLERGGEVEPSAA